jgi:probable rRNA maturation factor
MRSAAPSDFSLSVQYALRPADAPDRHALRRFARAAARGPLTATLRLVDEAEGRALNRDYRGRDYATNVLTFAYGADADADASGRLSGDIVLAAPVVSAEAAAQGKPVHAHYAHLVVHGMLHLQGHDHETPAEAHAMEALETAILARLGYPDPYATR